MRKPIVAGNWKMHKNQAEVLDFASEFTRKLGHHVVGKVDVVICPATAHICLLTAKGVLPAAVAVGGQDCHWEEKGAFTGCVSALQLKDLKARYVIVGHSERRRDFHEDEKMLGLKLKAALQTGLIPIYCVGEKLEERDKGSTFAVLERQMKALQPIVQMLKDPRHFVLAYEPVWAIGTGRNAAPEQAQEVHRYLRAELAKIWGEAAAQGIRILYGGSVNTQNFSALLAAGDVDGALVGGASLEAENFTQLVHIAAQS